VFRFCFESNKFKEVATYSGVIHCLEMAPNGQFITTSGKMPAHTVLYD